MTFLTKYPLLGYVCKAVNQNWREGKNRGGQKKK